MSSGIGSCTDTYRSDADQALGTVRDCFMAMAGLDPTVPIWITENGIPTGSGTTEAQHASGLTQLVQATATTRGPSTSPITAGSTSATRTPPTPPARCPGRRRPSPPPGCSVTTTPKPPFAAYRTVIAAFGQLSAPAPAGSGCQPHPFRVGLRRERSPIRRVDVYRRRRVGHAVGRRLRIVVTAGRR